MTPHTIQEFWAFCTSLWRSTSSDKFIQFYDPTGDVVVLQVSEDLENVILLVKPQMGKWRKLGEFAVVEECLIPLARYFWSRPRVKSPEYSIDRFEERADYYLSQIRRKLAAGIPQYAGGTFSCKPTGVMWELSKVGEYKYIPTFGPTQIPELQEQLQRLGLV